MRNHLASVLALTSQLAGCAVDDPDDTTIDQESRTGVPVLTPQTSGTLARLQSIAPINDRIAWVSGSAGTILRTTDGGETWEPRGIPGTETLAFRDIHAVSRDIAFVLTNNGGPNARIYKTVDGGLTWTLQFQSPIENTFYDCFAFWSPRHAIAIPDAEDGRFDVVRMTDGASWENIGDGFPAGQAGEGLFPTSGNCVTTLGANRAWAVLAGASPSRVVSTRDGGDTWDSHPIPIPGGPSGGGMNVLFRDRHHGVVSGGDVATPTVFQDNFARTSDGGVTWTLGTPAPFPGAAYALSYVPPGGGCPDHTVFAAGPSGAAWSRDEGDTWELVPGAATGYFSVEFASHRRGWLVGRTGTITRIDL
ncbi:MAG: YCF48-related protein [Kofleriaceae bacterium]